MSKEAYQKLWAGKAYRAFSPGEEIVGEFLRVARPMKHETVIDFGCGSGRAAKRISQHAKVIGLDFADNACETDIEFHVHDLREPITLPLADYGLCTDVMEHIAKEDVGLVLENILKAARKVFFQISTRDDTFTDEAGEHLHLTVKPMSWWVRQFERLGCDVKWASSNLDTVSFYVSAYLNWQYVAIKSVMTSEDLEQNVRINMQQGYTEVSWHEKQDAEIILLGGGPSLNMFESDIHYRHTVEHMPIVCTNGTYNWALERGLKPAAQIIVDGREWNKRFVEPVQPYTKYLLSSQCHPSVLNAVPRDQLFMWHPGKQCLEIVEEFRKDERPWFPVMGGSTVMLRAFPLLQLLGFYKYHVYGFDSCLLEDAHHAYDQSENDSERTVDIYLGGKVFKCHYWMAVQAREFMEEVRKMLQDCEMSVYGPGLIAQIVETGAELAPEFIGV